MGAKERFSGDFLKPYLKKRYYTAGEIRFNDCWVSYFGKVYDLTQLVADHPGQLATPIINASGTDISHWFDPVTRNPKMYVDPITMSTEIYCPQGRYIHLPPRYPSTDFDDVETPWWQDDKYFLGWLSCSVRKIRIVNLLTSQQEELEVPSEETLAEIQERYLEHNRHCKSYLWKRLGKPLDLHKSLEDNGMHDETDEFLKLGMDPDDYIPTIHLYFTDDLTEG